MTFALLTIAFAAMLPLLCAGLAKRHGFGRPVAEGGYDNRNPREWLARQTGPAAWANAAQANSWEALPFYAAAVIVNHLLGGAGLITDLLAGAFIVLRLLYVAMYVTGRHIARSMVWIASFVVNIAIFFWPVLGK
ncbi:MAG: MAPEG family protein [Casimicrobiaceae bacterium]|nr:MAPEG family protein [Casimicrobiaceae bacterium]MDW8311942.1 MAPEG family protein [Burkholderiales bacterium]